MKCEDFCKISQALPQRCHGRKLDILEGKMEERWHWGVWWADARASPPPHLHPHQGRLLGGGVVAPASLVMALHTLSQQLARGCPLLELKRLRGALKQPVWQTRNRMRRFPNQHVSLGTWWSVPFPGDLQFDFRDMFHGILEGFQHRLVNIFEFCLKISFPELKK